MGIYQLFSLQLQRHLWISVRSWTDAWIWPDGEDDWTVVELLNCGHWTCWGCERAVHIPLGDTIKMVVRVWPSEQHICRSAMTDIRPMTVCLLWCHWNGETCYNFAWFCMFTSPKWARIPMADVWLFLACSQLCTGQQQLTCPVDLLLTIDLETISFGIQIRS